MREGASGPASPHPFPLPIKGRGIKSIDCALQDMRGSECVHFFGAPGAAHVRFNHRPLDGLRRPAFVPEEDREIERREVAGEGPDRLGTRAVASVHVEREADDESDDMFAGAEGGKRFEDEVRDLALPIEFSLDTMGHFIDWSRDAPFQVIRGEGECAV